MIKVATVCCFMLAFLDEVEVKGEEARHIRKKCQAYIDKHPQHLGLVANTAWDVACNSSEDYEEWDPATTLVLLWEETMYEVGKAVGINTKYGEKLLNKQQVSLKAKINSRKIAKNCLQAINKVIYDNKEKLV